MSHLMARCTFFSRTHVPDLEAAMIALSAMLKPSSEPMAAEVSALPCDCASSVTLPLGSKPGTLTIMMGEEALLSFSTTSFKLKAGNSRKPWPRMFSTKRWQTKISRSGRRALMMRASCTMRLLWLVSPSARQPSGMKLSGSTWSRKACHLPSLLIMWPTSPWKQGSRCRSWRALSCCWFSLDLSTSRHCSARFAELDLRTSVAAPLSSRSSSSLPRGSCCSAMICASRRA
mmetsp:Transcript_37685/g.108619  ORF Transcript_37685/g.108619 Transcript_37685/m.108619 type:complete len:231 (+) Transcript_37685:75-767(+)